MIDSTSKHNRIETQRKQYDKEQRKYELYKHTQSCPKLTFHQLIPQKHKLAPLHTLSKERISTEQQHQLYQDPINRLMMKNILKDSYEQQISQQEQRKREERRLKIMQQKDYLSQFQNPQAIGRQLKRKKKELYKKQLLEEIEQKKVLINHVKTQETALSKKYQQPKSNHLTHKSQAFLQFYDQALKYQRKVEKQYKGYMKQQQKWAKQRNKQKLLDFKQNLDLMEQHSRQNYKLQQQKQMNLRKILNDQISRKQQEKKQSRKKKRYTQLYNPITNPFSRDIDPNNKYVIKELTKPTSKRQQMNK